MTKIIGLTGRIGSGKSTVARLLRKSGAAVIDTDRLTRKVYQPGTTGWKEIVNTFGKRVLTSGGEIDRTVLGNLVFNDRMALHKLQAITHPRILEMVQKYVEKYRAQNVPIVVIEAPLLLEARWNKYVDEVWLVSAPPHAVVERLKKQRNLNEKETTLRDKYRLSEVQLEKQSDLVILNNGNREKLKIKVLKEWARLMGERA